MGATFAAIDFETANHRRCSACAVGITVVEDGKIAKKIYHLIRPEPLQFDGFNVSIHGIAEDDVRNEPTFSQLWPELLSVIGPRPLVAHNASFDMSVLRHCLDGAGEVYPNLSYFCTLIISRRIWPDQFSYALDHLSETLNIPLNHHHASEDSTACAVLANKACEEARVESLKDLSEKINVRMGMLSSQGYTPCCISFADYKKIKAKDIESVCRNFDTSHPLYAMNIVITGELSSMPRRKAFQEVVDHGGHCQDSIRKDTNYLVLGQAGFIGYRSGHKSGKMKKAEEYKQKGCPVEIISENEFLRLL